MTAMSILRLLPQPSAKIVSGSVEFISSDKTIDLSTLALKDLQKIRGSEIACIFQEPMQALNPVLTIKKQLMEVFKFSAKKEIPGHPRQARTSARGDTFSTGMTAKETATEKPRFFLYSVPTIFF